DARHFTHWLSRNDRWPPTLNCRGVFLFPGLPLPRVVIFTYFIQNGMIMPDVMRQGFSRRRPVLRQHRREDLAVLADGFNRGRGVIVFPMEQSPVVAPLMLEEIPNVRIIRRGDEVFMQRLVNAWRDIK